MKNRNWPKSGLEKLSLGYRKMNLRQLVMGVKEQHEECLIRKNAMSFYLESS